MHLPSSVLFLAAAGLAAQVSGASIGKLGVVGELDYSLDLRYGKRHKRQDVGRNRGDNNNGGNNNNGGSQTCLSANALQTASAETGQNGEIAAGQIESKTDDSNFINFCSGQTLTNGLQNVDGSCNGVVMGKIPARSNMVSSIIVFPGPGQVLSSDATFNIQVQTRGLAAGAFTNAAKTYYSAPQDLDNGGNIIGHTHAVVQDLGGSFTPDQALDPTTFAFFKGINDNGDGNGLLSATIDGGLPVGFYRVCTMSSAANHQPVLMPVAQRGAQDDCTKFEVRAGNGNNNGGGNNNNGGGGAAGNTADPNSDGDESNDNNDNGGADTDNQNPDQANGGDNNDVEQGGNSGNDGANNNGDDDVATTTSFADASETSASDDSNGNNNNADIPDDVTSTESPAQETRTRGGGRGGRGRNRFNRLRTRTRDSAQATAAPNQTEVPDTNENVVATTFPAEATKTAEPVSDGGADGEDEDNQDESQDRGDAPTGPAESEPTSTSPAAEDPAETSAPDVPAPDTQAPDVAEPVKSGDLGGEAPPIENSGDAKRPFCVGKDKFAVKAAAIQRSCDKQFNRCADAVNSGRLSGKTLQDCEVQRQRCGK